jgi:hypothetical protein
MKNLNWFLVAFIFILTGLPACEQMQKDLKNPVMTKPKKNNLDIDKTKEKSGVTKEDMIKVYNYVLDEYEYLKTQRNEIIRLDPKTEWKEHNEKKQMFLVLSTGWITRLKGSEEKLGLSKKYPAEHPVNELRRTLQFMYSEWKNCKTGWINKRKFKENNFEQLEQQIQKTKKTMDKFMKKELSH